MNCMLKLKKQKTLTTEGTRVSKIGGYPPTACATSTHGFHGVEGEE